ncbi:carboxypeptidase regulatory-like domain-containing protein [Tolypothrix sp. FACHB-123]|uniref:SdrD B-like domain-containing protein n=1 Tax=Tolypothrix sp. FACHB-123 TaxID=2692868 RepID=UPI0016898B9A|nr:SdrD B-like domain-containing protein [Tolypothrix sp. FACHB-123]MBD2357200.1 carboxypeptidase regulatory-like domain-containing protein [Tolypothrix sp. FACHB-123]
MKPLLKNLPTPLRSTFLTLLLTAPQIPLGSLSSQKAVAQNVTCPANTRLVNLNWSELNFQTANFNQTFNIGGVNINFRMVENPPGFIRDLSPGALGPVPFGIQPGPYGGIDKPYLRWGIDAIGRAQGTATLIITSDQPIVLPSSLLFLDVDRNRSDETGFQDQITVTASNAGVNVPVTLVRANGNVPSVTEVIGNVARGQNPRVEPGNAPPESSAGNVAATFAGPVTSVQIVYQSGPLFAPPNPGPGQDETIGLATDIGVCIPGASIGDTVFNDNNGNNAQDPGEPGIPGVGVEIRDGNGNVVGTATTDNNGQYRVSNLPAGQYTASVPQIPNGLTPTLTQPNPITLTAGQNYDLADFGFRPPANSSIGDTVYNDINGNQQQDSNEPGIANVTLNLTLPGNDGILGNADDTTQTTTTNANGNYNFSNLTAGNYRVTLTPPTEFTEITTGNAQIDVNLPANQSRTDVDFGLRRPTTGVPGSIGDTVYNDIDGDGQQDANEPGISNVTLTLTQPGNDGILGNDDDTTQTTTTNANGIYNFNNLPAGNYRVTLTPPTEFTEITTGNAQIDVNLPVNQSRTDVDFGLRRPVTGNSSVGDTVYNDINGNRQQDSNEPGIPNVTVNLTLPGNDGILGNDDDTTRTTTTNNNGNYVFNNLPAGNFRVSLITPDDFSEITTGNPQVDVTLQANQSRTDVDFGLRNPVAGTASIGDTVYNDVNGNAQQDANEPGIANVTVNLILPGNDGILGNADDTTQTTTTNGNGNYNFNELPAGNYRVRVIEPEEFPQITTGNPQVDVTLQANQSRTDVDFGFRRPGTGAGGDGNILLVKRITAIASTNTQGNQFNTFVDDPNDQNDNALSSVAIGQYEIPTPLQSGDEVEYTIYFRTDGSLENINFCDLIPQSTTYLPNSISVTGGGTGADGGRFFPPLTPIEQIPESSVCENRNNPNGTVIVKLGNIPTAQSGSVRFRVRVN